MFNPRRPSPPTALIALAWTLAACAEPAPSRFPVRVRVESAPGVPVDGARVWAGGRDLGTADPAGRIDATLTGFEGDRVSLVVACPSGLRPDAPARDVPLRRIEDDGRSARPLELVLRCASLELDVALVVRAEGLGARSLPIEVQDHKVGQTDGAGIAHVLLSAQPGSSVRVKLVTVEYPSLEPRDPVQTFRVGDEDLVLLVAQSFDERRHPKARPRALPLLAPPAPPPARPYRIQ